MFESPLPRAVLCVVAIVIGACQPNPASYGPLAVLGPSTGSSDSLGGTGDLSITPDCVTLSLPNGETLLLVWHSNRVTWSEQRHEIAFENVDGESFVLSDGGEVTVGGESLIGDGGELNREVEWIAELDPGCQGEAFIVTQVSAPPT